jgi:hypothetical protein
MTNPIPSKNDAARSRDSDPLLYDIDKHARAAANHRCLLRDKIVRAHHEGYDHTIIADTAGVTLGAVETLIEQVEALVGQSDLVYASS